VWERLGPAAAAAAAPLAVMKPVGAWQQGKRVHKVTRWSGHDQGQGLPSMNSQHKGLENGFECVLWRESAKLR
jgi:hypothetical protein